MTTRLLVFSLVTACASSTPGARPHDMSAVGHDNAAREHDRAAVEHDRLYDTQTMNCRPNLPRPPICWTSIQNPTDDHRRVADTHRKAAADHRAASQALRTAEASACVGLADIDRDSSPFDHVEDIASVEPLVESTGTPKVPRTQTVGAIVTFRARPALTAEWLQRVVDCHLARNAALGHVVPDMPDCPLVPKNVTARVTSTGNGFAVAIRGNDEKVARDVLERARRASRRTITSRSDP